MARRAAPSPGDPEQALREAAIRMVETSCQARGLPVKITDRGVLDAVARLLVESRELRD